MATSKAQRTGILIILFALVFGTIGSFYVMILAQQNTSQKQAELQRLQTEYQDNVKKYQAKVDAQGQELSKKYYDIFNPHASHVAEFDIENVKEISTEDMVVGDGEEVKGDTKLAAYYVGWDGHGHVFDQSIDSDKKALKAPLLVSTGLDQASLIEGWKEGMKGMRINGVRLITIPSEKAYGEMGSKDSSGKETIAPNMPLKFVVMAIPAPEEIPQPDSSAYFKAMMEAQQP